MFRILSHCRSSHLSSLDFSSTPSSHLYSCSLLLNLYSSFPSHVAYVVGIPTSLHFFSLVGIGAGELITYCDYSRTRSPRPSSMVRPTPRSTRELDWIFITLPESSPTETKRRDCRSFLTRGEPRPGLRGEGFFGHSFLSFWTTGRYLWQDGRL